VISRIATTHRWWDDMDAKPPRMTADGVAR